MAERDASIEALLEHASWVGRLARSLVGPDRAEDLAQDVWVRALRRPPRASSPESPESPGEASYDGSSLRAWLARVARNRARETRRGEARRSEREARVAASETVDDPIERLTVHRDLVDRVAELEDPWRRTVVLRFFDDLSLKEIAAREGVPLSTVNTRLRKAKELLRTRLDADHGGDRAAWMAALAPLVRDVPPPVVPVHQAPNGALTPSAAGAAVSGVGAPLLVMKLPYVVSLVAAAAVATYFVLPDREVAPIEPPPGTRAAEPVAAVLEPVPERAVAAPASSPLAERRAATVAPAAASPEPAQAGPPEEQPAAAPLQGQVIDTDGKPMRGLEVWLATGDDTERLLGVSGPDGSFPVDGARDIGLIEVRDERWGTVLGCRLPRGARQGPTLIVAPWLEVGGYVVNEDGAPIPGAQLAIGQPTSLRASAPDLHGSSKSYEPRTKTDAQGNFLFERALSVEGTTVYVEAQGYANTDVQLPTTSTRTFEVVMHPPQATQDAVHGRVVDATGRPVPEAWVSLGYLSVQTDAEGRFRVDTGREGHAYDRVIAVKAGHLPVVVERPTALDGEPAPWPEPLIVELGGVPLELAGRLVDAAGEPLAGWRIWPGDPTFFSSVDQRGVMAEGVAMGLLDASDPDVEPTAAWPWARTDEDGRFRLGGLLDREYELRVLHAPSLLLVSAGSYLAGRRDVEIVLDLEDFYGPVAGRVIDTEGHPVPGVTVENWVSTYTAPHFEDGYLGWAEDGPSVLTDEDGRYSFERLPLSGVTLQAKHPDILPVQYTLSRDDDGDPADHDFWDAIDLVCERRFHLQVEVSSALAEQGSIVLLGAEGDEQLIQVFSAGGRMSTRRYRFEEGKTEVLSIPGTVRELVLYDMNQNELARRDLTLVFGELNEVRL